MLTCKRITFLAIPLFLVFFFTSCVKDIDLEQIEEVVVSPKIATDLVSLTFSSPDFVPEGYEVPLKVREEVLLEGVNTEFLDEGLTGVDLHLFYSNTFSHSFRNTITFVTKRKSVRHVISVDIPAGSSGAPEVINLVEVLQGKDLEIFKKAVKIVIELEIEPGAGPMGGELQLKSSAVYKFRF